MSDQDAPSKTISDFEAKLKDADSAVASFEKDDHTPLRVAQAFLRNNPTLVPALVLLVSILCFGAIAPRFMTPSVLSTIMQQVTVTGFVALAQTLIILTAGIDLSVGAVMVICALIMGRMAVLQEIPVPIAIGVAVFFGALMGWINGFLVAKIKLPPFIVTLGTLSVFSALKLWYSHSASIRNFDIVEKAPSLLWFGTDIKFMGATVTYGVVSLIVLAVILWYALNHTAWGRHVHAVGDDPEAATLSGIQTDRVLISVYVVAGVILAFAAWVSIGRVGSVNPISFDTVNLASITAVVIGGTSLFGGRGSIVGSVLGAFIVQVFTTGLSLARVDDYWQQFAVGVLVIIAVALDQSLRRASK
jgi:fructose transport system permease protein